MESMSFFLYRWNLAENCEQTESDNWRNHDDLLLVDKIEKLMDETRQGVEKQNKAIDGTLSREQYKIKRWERSWTAELDKNVPEDTILTRCARRITRKKKKKNDAKLLVEHKQLYWDKYLLINLVLFHWHFARRLIGSVEIPAAWRDRLISAIPARVPVPGGISAFSERGR